MLTGFKDSRVKKEEAQEDVFAPFKSALIEGLSVTLFIHLAKQSLHEPIYNQDVEAKIKEFTKASAKQRGINADALCEFVDKYCAISKALQSYWVEHAGKVEYQFTAPELSFYESLRKDFSSLPEKPSVEALQDAFASDGDLARSVRDKCRAVIGSTNITMFNAIQSLGESGQLEDIAGCRNALTQAVKIVVKNYSPIKYNDLCDWGNAMSNGSLGMKSKPILGK